MLLNVQNITKTYVRTEMRAETFKALDNVSLYVEQGECVGIIGPSGSGKSTLAHVIAGLEAPDCGTITFDGVTRGVTCGVARENGTAHSRGKRARIKTAWAGMQMIFQNPEASFLPSMTMGRAIAEGIAYQTRQEQTRLTKKECECMVNKALEEVGLPASFAQKHAFEMSGGQCQRAAIARAIIGNPKLIICDEPTSALDVTVQARIMELLEHLHQQHGVALVFISHNMALVNNLCSRIYCLEAGHITDHLVAS